MTATIIVVFTVAAVYYLDHQDNQWIKRILDWIPAILFAYVIPAIITHATGWKFSDSYLHLISKEWIIPLAIVAVMSALSFRQLKMIGFRPILLFVGGSFVIATLPVILVLMTSLISTDHITLFVDEGYWKGLVPIVGGWIGGSTSQLILKELSGCPESLFLAVLVLDNILVNIWTILMFQSIKRSDDINRLLSITDQVPDFVPDEIEGQYKNLKSILATLLLVIMAVLTCYFLHLSFLWTIIVLSLIGLAYGNFIPFWNHSLVLKLGGILIILIMAILGLKLNFSGFAIPGIFVGVVVTWLILHFIFMTAFAYFLKLHMAWVPIASMANLGGISTAPAVTAAYNEEWMPHAILLAILSMVTGTAWGMFTIFLFNLL